VLLVILLVVVLMGVAIVVVLRLRRSGQAPSPSRATGPAVEGQVEVTLPVDHPDPENPATQRLVGEAVSRALAADPQVQTVVVLSRDGQELGRVERTAPPVPRPFVDSPIALREPHAPRHVGPREPIQDEHPTAPPGQVHFKEEERSPAHRSLADHFEFPDALRERIHDREDPVEIVRAIFEEAGVTFDADGNVFRRGDHALVVLRAPLHTVVDPESLNTAFLRFQRSGAKRGVVVTVGTLYSHEVHRRELLAPQLLHTGPEGIQRMADAVAVGADPLDFVVRAA
jgi:hypothetical protein